MQQKQKPQNNRKISKSIDNFTVAKAKNTEVREKSLQFYDSGK